jgi:hypothetical protein
MHPIFFVEANDMIDDLKTTWESDVKVVDNTKINMYFLLSSVVFPYVHFTNGKNQYNLFLL